MEIQSLLRAARIAVIRATVLARSVQSTLGRSDTLIKADASPVTTADYGVQAIISLSLRAHLGNAPFSLLAEESAATLRVAGGELLEAVVAAVNSAYPRSTWAAERMVTEGNGDNAGSVTSWCAKDVLDAIDAGSLGDGAQLPEAYWILDPIDGTKGFLRGGQYCVGLAYAERGVPVIGVLGCPNLSYPAGMSANGNSLTAVGSLFSGWAGGQAFQEPLLACSADAKDTAARVPIAVSPATTGADAIICESFEAGHSDHGR